MEKTDHDLLIRIDERLDKVLKCVEEQGKLIKIQNGRILSLEKWKWIQIGVWSVVAVISGSVSFIKFVL